ncbi:MAG: haloacid dehalogenase, partial [Muribaculaceae bacterium]|nr:haloacid dehalogenase [Muribaculaceae bacterium]
MNPHKTPHGLTPQQVKQSRAAHGENVLTPPPRPSLWRKFLSSFSDPLIKVLLVALLLSIGISIYEYLAGAKGASVFFEPAGIFFAIALATLIGFWLEVSADRKFEILNQVNDDLLVKVIRSGGVSQIPRREVVVGDLVLIEQGDEIVADGRLLDSMDLLVNESSLTGEPQV